MTKKKPTKPVILVDTYERNTKILEKIIEYAGNKVEVTMKSGGAGDYIIVDAEGHKWGIEYKSFLDCYSSIIDKDPGTKTGRIYGQLAELIKEFDGRAILMIGAPEYFPKRIQNPYLIKKIVYSFVSHRSLVMPTWMIVGADHAGKLLVDMALKIHKEEFHGRGYKIIAFVEP
jgi:ERCC4-type nuclease